METCLVRRQTRTGFGKAPPCGRVSPTLLAKSSFSLPQAPLTDPLWRQNTGVNATVLSFRKAIPPFLWGGKMSGTKSEGLLYPPWGDENFAYHIYKLRENRMGSLTSCSAQFCVGSHATPATAPFGAFSRSNATTICDVWFALPHPLPKGRTVSIFFTFNECSPPEAHHV